MTPDELANLQEFKVDDDEVRYPMTLVGGPYDGVIADIPACKCSEHENLVGPTPRLVANDRYAYVRKQYDFTTHEWVYEYDGESDD